MRIEDAVVVVTGAGSGIGAAMARRLVGDGARAVVVTDRDGAAAARVAVDIGAGASGAQLDVTDAAAVGALAEQVRDEHGAIDLFCSNAGLTTGIELEDRDDLWRAAFDVHVMAHVYAARAVLPAMLDRGRGYLLNTASAAGLLTSPGDAPYAVTKHGAVAFAEWLSVSYGGRGIGVSVLCPMGVATPLLLDPLAAGEPGAQAVAASAPIVSVEQVAEDVARGIAEERFLILPHPQVATFWAQKATDPDRWLAGMRRMIDTSHAHSGDAAHGDTTDRDTR